MPPCPSRSQVERRVSATCGVAMQCPLSRRERIKRAMTQTTNRFFDEMARLMNDATGVAQGVRREFDTLLRNQAERMLRDLDVVKREDFEAVKEMARLAREENEALAARVAALDRKSTRLNSSHRCISYAVFCLKKKTHHRSG